MNDSASRCLRGIFFCALSLFSFSLARAQTVPPYAIDFETANSVTTGDLNGQDGWIVTQGAATVTAAQAISGINSVLLAQGTLPAQITRAFGAPASGFITYTDYFAQPNVAWTIDASTRFEVEGSKIGLVRLDGNGQLLAWDGNGSGNGRWVVTGKSIALDGGGLATSWTRFTIRQNYTTKKWDLYVDGVMVAHDLGFRDDTKTSLSLFKLTAAATTDSYFDDFYAGADNPLFTDADNDGMDDAWETAHGLNAALDDRNADLDSDGLSNLEEYVAGTNPNSTDSDGDGLPDAWEIDHGSNALVDDGASDPGEVGRTLLQSYTGNLSPWPAPTVASGLRAWFRADKGVTMDGSDKVSSWLDMSGHARRVLQMAYAERQPLYVASALNGHPVVQYNDSHQALVTAGLADVLDGASDATVIAVVKPENAPNYAGTIFYWDTDGNWNMGLTAYGASHQYQMVWRDGDGNTRLSPALNAAAGTVQVLTAVKDGTTASAFINGLSQGSFEVPAGMNLLPSRLAVGNSASPYYSFHGQIAEVLVYNRALTASERETIEAALAAKYINPDADGDGLPDVWEDQYLGTRSFGAGDDPYGVGRTLLQSCQQSLSPLPAPALGNGLRAWYRADAGVTKDGDNKISQWVDLSGHGFHVVQINDASRQPLFAGGALNGHAAVQYDDSHQALVSPGPVNVADGASDATIIAVVKPENVPNYAGTIFYWDTDGNWNMGLTAYGASHQYQMVWRDGGGNTQLSPALNAAAGTVQVLTAIKDGTTASAFINGLSQGSAEVPAGMNLHPSRLAVGNSDSPYYSFHGQIAEVLVYNRALTPTERATIESALMARYINPDADGDGLPDAWEDQYLGTRLYGAADDPGSVGRTLLQSYQQSLSPWPAPTVSGGLRAWYRADAGVTRNGSNKVSQWTDVSGHGFHVVQINDPGRQPLYASTALNGHPVVQYDSSQQALVSPSPVNVADGASDATVIAVVKPENAPNYAGTIFYWDTDGNWNMGLTAYGASHQYQLVWRDGAGNTQLSPALNTAAGAVQILTAVKDGATASAFINGLLQGGAEVPAGMNLLPSRLAVGNSASPYYSFHGQIAEVLVYNRALTPAERATIEAELAAKYINPDADGDGLPDTWEDQYLGTRTYGTDDDPFGVGRTLLQSYQQSLSPLPAPVVASGLRAWFRADKGVIKDGDNGVSQWADLSGHGFHVQQVNDSTRRPLYVASAINGKPALQYDQSTRALVTPAPVDVSAGANDATVIAVVRPQGEPNYAGTIFYWDTDGNYNMGLSSPNGSDNQYALIWRADDGSSRLSPTTTVTTDQIQIITATKEGTAAAAYLNGVLQGQSEVPAGMDLQSSRLAVGNASYPYYSFHGQIAEVLVYNRALSDTERTSIETALTTRYLQAGNQGPTVELTAPAAGTVNGTSGVNLTASATDTDGTIAKVEFFADGTKLGEDTTAPYSFNWSAPTAGAHELTARATDDAGTATTSAAVSVTVTITESPLAIFSADFETAEGYVVGPIADQQGWVAFADSIAVEARADAPSGENVLSASWESPFRRSFSPVISTGKVYVDFYANYASASAEDYNATFSIGGAGLGFRRNATESAADIFTIPWDAPGAGFTATGTSIPLDENSFTGWHRYTLRIDFDAHKWDLYLDRNLIASNLTLGPGGLAMLYSSSSDYINPFLFDALAITTSDPLITDVDHDGMDDTWELAHGLNPALNDSAADPDGDGLSNATEYALGTDPQVANLSPTVALTDPVAGTVDGSSGLNLFATAGDSDGTVTKVEFFVDGVKLGQDTTAPYSFSWSTPTAGDHVLTAKATDNTGMAAVSEPTSITITIDTSLIFKANFEPDQGYTLGSLAGQKGWNSSYSNTLVEATDEAPAGSNAISLGAEGSVFHELPNGMGTGIVFVDFYAKSAISGNVYNDNNLQVLAGGARLTWRADAGGAFANVLLGSTREGTGFEPSAAQVALDPDGISGWHRYTLRLDYTTHQYDAYVDGEPCAADIGLGYDSVDRLSLSTSAITPAWADEIQIRSVNPLFTDADHDGMDDAWEVAHGLDPTVNDRDGDPDGDGLTNIQEYAHHSDPHLVDSDVDGIPDLWEVQHGLNPNNALDAAEDFDGDGLSNFVEYTLGTDIHQETSAGSSIPDAELDTDGDGVDNLHEVQQGTDPHDYYNGQTPIITPLADYSEQLGPDSMFAVRVTDAQGHLLVNAPVEFTTSTESLLTRNPYGLGVSLSVVARSDDEGIARVYIRPAN